MIIYIDTQGYGGRERTEIDTEPMNENTHSHILCVIRVLWSKIATDTKLLREKLQRGYHNIRKARLEESGGSPHSTMVDPRRVTCVSGVVTTTKVLQR